MNCRVKAFVFGALAFWAIVALPARLLGGTSAFVYSLVALGMCAAPTAALLYGIGHFRQRSPVDGLFLYLGGSGLRMGLVLGVALTLYLACPYFQGISFWIWLLVFYLYVLALEICLILIGRRRFTG